MSEGEAFLFQDQSFIARASRALYWPDAGALVVADLHFGKSARLARRGGALLPPWDNSDTLTRLEAEIAALNPSLVIALGDSFDDDAARAELDAADEARLQALMSDRRWHWVSGNHDPAGGVPELSISGIAFRHETGPGPDISGHLHPVLRLAGRRWRCFAWNRQHLILPAFGSYTGGLDVEDPGFREVMPEGRAIVIAGNRLMQTVFPAPRGRIARRGSGGRASQG